MSNASIARLASTASRGWEDIYNKALKFLEQRLHSVSELKRKLLLRGYNPLLVDEVTGRLLESGYLNDEQFAQVFLDNLIKYKTFGFYGLKAKLLQRGIDRELVASLLSNFSLENEKRIALKLIEKKTEKDQVKLARSLASKGFRNQVIKQVLTIGQN